MKTRKKFTISGVGCSLVDNLYTNISFSGKKISPYLSIENGDGGLVPGQLVLKEDFEDFIKKRNRTGFEKNILDKSPNKINLGGPGIVPMIHAAQLSDNGQCEFRFYGTRGNDANGDFIISLLKKTKKLDYKYKITNDETPSTMVLSDPDYDEGNGERIFVNTIGTAWKYSPDALDTDFFNSDIVVFGGTALTPLIHNNLTELLEKSKANGCLTIVNTVYDFINEKKNPTLKWPLGKSDASYKNIDLLIMDHVESLRLSGTSDIDNAIQFFCDLGVGSIIITNGSENIKLFSNGKLFRALSSSEMPISNAVSSELKKGLNTGDTTGCGDNFVGGIIASIVSQIQKNSDSFDLIEACIWGIISGGTTCFYVGGMFEEKFQGEKRELIEPYYKQYKNQIYKIDL
ncbi:MAG: carbohydrate kinase family protein [Flavobacteriaceae bacterium]|nr:carbohydrate kinase family protein [Flavobacteriaceae bacterium]